jgi:hypothetical protein
MKSKGVIAGKITELWIERDSAKEKYAKLGQIDMLSGEGTTLLKKIDRAEGGIEQLLWVLGGINCN